MDKYNKIAVSKSPTYKESLFAQGDANKGNDGRGGGNNRSFDDTNMTISNSRTSNYRSVAKRDM